MLPDSAKLTRISTYAPEKDTVIKIKNDYHQFVYIYLCDK